MAFGFGVLRLSPTAFWMMTPRELAAGMRAIFPEAGRFDRGQLGKLMRSYPDESRT
jgi:uncharacterized phage protein (TIGR02216 family)